MSFLRPDVDEEELEDESEQAYDDSDRIPF